MSVEEHRAESNKDLLKEVREVFPSRGQDWGEAGLWVRGSILSRADRAGSPSGRLWGVLVAPGPQ